VTLRPSRRRGPDRRTQKRAVVLTVATIGDDGTNAPSKDPPLHTFSRAVKAGSTRDVVTSAVSNGTVIIFIAMAPGALHMQKGPAARLPGPFDSI
jgi:hypothetical protein